MAARSQRSAASDGWQPTVIRDGLDDKTRRMYGEASYRSPGEADVVARIAIVVRKQLGPPRIQPNAIAPDHRRVEVGLKQARACPPDVEIPVTASLDRRKTLTSGPTSAMGKGEASALLKVADNAIPVVTTAQFVELSRRVRQTILR